MSKQAEKANHYGRTYICICSSDLIVDMLSITNSPQELPSQKKDTINSILSKIVSDKTAKNERMVLIMELLRCLNFNLQQLSALSDTDGLTKVRTINLEKSCFQK